MTDTERVYLKASLAMLRLREQIARLEVEIARDNLRNHFALRRPVHNQDGERQ
jgi:hypothetical protein